MVHVCTPLPVLLPAVMASRRPGWHPTDKRDVCTGESLVRGCGNRWMEQHVIFINKLVLWDCVLDICAAINIDELVWLV